MLTVDRNEIVSREFLYVHFEKRKINLKRYQSSREEFILIPHGSIVSKYSEISPDYISRCYSLDKEFCWGLKRIVKRVIRKTKYIMSGKKQTGIVIHLEK